MGAADRVRQLVNGRRNGQSPLPAPGAPVGEGQAVELYRRLERAQKGDGQAREQLLLDYRPFVLKTGAAVAKRYIRAGVDDEASIAMLAFDEAITSFDRSQGLNFLGFAEMVIRRRLIDHYRRAERHRREVPLSALEAEAEEGESDGGLLRAETREALREHEERVAAFERREEILSLRQELAQFGIDFQQLARIAPRHRDARERAVAVARQIAASPEVMAELRQRRALPLKVLEGAAGVSRKTLERQRKYIIAVALILSGEYERLREYVTGLDGHSASRPEQGRSSRA